MNKKIVSKTKMNVITKKNNEKEDPNGFETDSFNTNSTEEEFSDTDKDTSESDLSDKDVKLDKDDTLINFDWSEYINYYEDLKQLNTKEKAWKHWINHGKKEKRKFFKLNRIEIKKEEEEKIENYNDFDWYKYVDYHKDLKKINNKEKAWEHWINNGRKEKRMYFSFNHNITSDEYKNFEWENYINNYDDLKKIDNKEKAWEHWINHGKKEKRVTFNIYEKKINENKIEDNKKNIIFKKIYENYGNSYYGWENVINQFVFNFKKTKKEFKNNYFFDEWIEKLVLYENSLQSKEYLKTIKSKKYKLISFLHYPPCLNLNDDEYKNNVLKNIIMNEEEDNQNILNNLDVQLNNHLEFLYVLSNDHKKYIYNNYPNLKNKIVSVSRPINMKVKIIEKKFKFSLFKNEQNIFFIGDLLSNFKSFINFIPEQKYKKSVLIKNDFIKHWNNHILKYNKIDKIKVINELSNEEYVKIFETSCIFIDFEDCVANNLILECLKFNTPFIIKHNKSIQEYIGVNYPLYFNNTDDLNLFSDEIYFLNKIENAHHYLKKLNKNHIELDTFNKKIFYDLNKFELTSFKYKLTWLCILNDDFSLHTLNNLLDNFIKQDGQNELQLVFITYPSLNIEKLNNQTFLKYNNVKILEVIEDTREWLDKLETEYILVVDLNDKYKKNYSITCSEVLDKHPNNDVIFSSFKSINKKLKEDDLHDDEVESKLYKYREGMYFIDDIESVFPNSGFVFRKSLIDLLDISFIFMDNKDIYQHFISNHLNVVCISEKPLFLTERIEE